MRLFLVVLVFTIHSEPIIVTGSMVPTLIGIPIKNIRVSTRHGKGIPYQIDEKTSRGEYICPEGERPNTDSANGILDSLDEIVFLWNDIESIQPNEATPNFDPDSGTISVILTITNGSNRKIAVISNSKTIKRSQRTYIEYNDERQLVRTPYYFAQFGQNRFHFTKAGVKDFSTGEYRTLTKELRVEIVLRALWGLLPIRYTEDNLVCLVRRYKVGPIRLIRRGDFHLNLGLGVHGSHASVNQICYPQAVQVPVYVHVPFRFKTLFKEAYIDMTPVLRHEAKKHHFRSPRYNIEFPIGGTDTVDTLLPFIPSKTLMTVHNGNTGYGWLLQANIGRSLLDGSGFIFRRPSHRNGYADCGFRLTIRDVPKGYYKITNWVLFSKNSTRNLKETYHRIMNPAQISTHEGKYYNKINNK